MQEEGHMAGMHGSRDGAEPHLKACLDAVSGRLVSTAVAVVWNNCVFVLVFSNMYVSR